MSSTSTERSAQGILLSNFPDTGIGAFGEQLHRALELGGTHLPFESAATTWREFVPQWFRLLHSPAPVVANIGLTSWGRSRFRNLLGLWALGYRARRGRPTTILLHNLIEAVDPVDAGYRLGRTARYFAHSAVAGLRRAQIVVFSRELGRLLQSAYGIVPAREEPLPCDPPVRPQPSYADPPEVLAFGYLSPYKGVDLLLRAMEGIDEPVRCRILGKPHSLLGSDPDYRRYLENLHELAVRTRSEFLGFLPLGELEERLQRAFAGVLSYTSTTGASASFTQLASAGLPVIASDLPEFQNLRAEGAGVLLVDATPEAIRTALTQLLHDPERWSRLSRAQLAYAAAHSWQGLSGWIAAGARTGSAPRRAAPTADSSAAAEGPG
ncbi:MAG: glycosyltransferase [Thermoplasmata archaeon]|nr:glycosyltransferase [Thermoplasmata archaeon]